MTTILESAKPDKTEHYEDFSLTEKQNIAVTELVKGATDEEAAKVAGVARTTVNEWKNTHPAFRAALVNKRAEIWAETKRPLQDAIIAALETVNNSIKGGDSKTAQWLLDKVGIDELAKATLKKMEVYPTTPEYQLECIASEKEMKMERLAKEVTRRRMKELGIDDFDDPYDKKQKEIYAEALRQIKAAA
jgi:hypothetical protein